MAERLRVSGAELERRRVRATRLGERLSSDTGRFVDDRIAADVVALYAGLGLKPGYRLVTTYFRDGIGGFGETFALPEDSPNPAPDEIPEAALPDFMEVIEGDDSIGSYAQASILRREIEELGAWWHGLTWATHTILNGPNEPEALSGVLSWRRDKTADRTPFVRLDRDMAEVTFWTISSFGQERVFRHTDWFARGNYRQVRTSRRTVATGTAGYIF